MAIAKHFHSLHHHLYYLLVLLTFYYQVLSELFLNALESARLISYRKWADIPDCLAGKTVVITGVDSGIGRATLEEVAVKGATVIFTCLSSSTQSTLAGELIGRHPHIKRRNLMAVRLDLASRESIEKCAETIKNCTPVIDVLINNAGVMCPSDKVLQQQQNQPNSTKEEYHFQVNYLGHLHLTLLLISRLKKSTDARIVNLTSFTHLIGYPLFSQTPPLLLFRGPCVSAKLKAYSRSKLAILLSTQTLAGKLKGDSVKVFAVHPGGTISSIVGHIAWLHRLQQAAGAPFQLTPLMGAQTTLHCAFSLHSTEVTATGSGFYFE